MELAGVAAIFNRSMEQNGVRYTQYEGDGDSKSFQHVVCLKPYGNATTIENLECLRHIQKRMGARLHSMHSKNKTVLEDGKKLSGKSRLTLNVIYILQNYYGIAIRKITDNLHNIFQAVWSTFYQKMSRDEEPKHGLCPSG